MCARVVDVLERMGCKLTGSLPPLASALRYQAPPRARACRASNRPLNSTTPSRKPDLHLHARHHLLTSGYARRAASAQSIRLVSCKSVPTSITMALPTSQAPAQNEYAGGN